MVHFFNSLVILTVVGWVTLCTNVETKASQENIVDSTITYRSSVNRVMKTNSVHNMRKDKNQPYTDCKDPIL
ncbi:hypothetical protein AAW12_00510 [Sphingobacterium sp. Ag1]|nr:hypothetical protein AAW12_00510 [Sphingobacterium sp. Ag1]